MAGIIIIPENTNFGDLIPLINDRLTILAGGVGGTGGGQTTQEIKTEILALLDEMKVYDQAGMVWGKPVAGARVFLIPSVRAFTLPIDCDGSRARAIIPSTTSAVFTIKKSGTTIGTITFSAGVLVGTFSMVSAVNFTDTDYLEIIAPAVQDATLLDVAWNLKILFS